MNLTSFDFEKKYNDFLSYLYTFEDIKYKKFHSKLILDNNLIGIRMPILKQMAKEIAKGDYINFIKNNTLNTYEEKMLYGLVLGYLKVDFKELLVWLDMFIPNIDNWAICDCVCANLKGFKKNLDEGYNYILKCLKSNNEFEIRFGLVLLLDFYVNEQYINKIFKLANEITNDGYYVKMANAWLISKCYIKFPEKTYEFLLYCSLDDFTFNKTISKICDSYQVIKEEKNKVRKLKK